MRVYSQVYRGKSPGPPVLVRVTNCSEDEVVKALFDGIPYMDPITTAELTEFELQMQNDAELALMIADVDEVPYRMMHDLSTAVTLRVKMNKVPDSVPRQWTLEYNVEVETYAN